MGLGDEIMALGRAETIFEKTGQPVAITRAGGYARTHDAWRGNPAWNSHYADGKPVTGGNQIVDGGGARPYIKHWNGRQAVFNMEHRARAGRIWLTDAERDHAADLPDRFAVVAPYVKKTASSNKDWGAANWERVIDGLPLPVYQLVAGAGEVTIRGARTFFTPTFRQAAAVIARAQVVMCNEGGTHHMAASMGRPAVVIFGSFTPPCVTGYDFHRNISVQTMHGFCGNFDRCKECAQALASITPDVVKSEVQDVLGVSDE